MEEAKFNKNGLKERIVDKVSCKDYEPEGVGTVPRIQPVEPWMECLIYRGSYNWEFKNTEERRYGEHYLCTSSAQSLR